MQEFIDATLFLGTHSTNEALRVACKNYFVERYEQSLGMSDDQAGKCDRIIWQYSRELQDIYYPYMDRLRTDMDIRGLEYEAEDVTVALSDQRFDQLRVSQKLTLGMVLARAGKLYTVDAELHKLNLTLPQEQQLAIFSPQMGDEKTFPNRLLEECYQKSLSLSIS